MDTFACVCSLLHTCLPSFASPRLVHDPIKEERLKKPHLWQTVADVRCETRQATHKDGDEPIHLHLEDLVILVVVLELTVVFTGHEEKREV